MWKSWNYFLNFYQHQLSLESFGDGGRSRAGGNSRSAICRTNPNFQAGLVQDTSHCRSELVKVLVTLVLAG